jgi:DNA-binding response OmpR family regulator
MGRRRRVFTARMIGAVKSWSAAGRLGCGAAPATILEMKTVLVVADDEWVTNDVEAGLSDERVAIVVESDPYSVTAKAAEISPQLYLIDLQVGSMGGMALIRSIKADMGLGKIPMAPMVLMIDRDADSFLAKRAGADRWIRKPFTAQELRSVRDAVLPVG